MEAEEGLYLFIPLGRTCAMCSDILRLRLLMGLLSYIEVVHELLLLAQSHQRKATKKE